jgi:hypothetical protein
MYDPEDENTIRATDVLKKTWYDELMNYRTWFFVISVVMWLAIAGFMAGAIAIRYTNPITEVFSTPKYWHYWWPVPIATFVWFYTAVLITSNTRSYGLFLILTLIGAGAEVAFVIMEVITLADCNDFNGLIPEHPACINRHYSADTFPDPTFLLTFVGGIGMALACFFCWALGGQIRQAWVCQQMTGKTGAGYARGGILSGTKIGAPLLAMGTQYPKAGHLLR